MKLYKLFKSKNPPTRPFRVVLPVSPPEKIPLRVFRNLHPANRKYRFVLPGQEGAS